MAKIRVIAESTELVNFAQSPLIEIQNKTETFIRSSTETFAKDGPVQGPPLPEHLSYFIRSTHAIVGVTVGVGRTDVAKIWVIAESTDLCYFRPIAHC
jgi:hypothetical protein